MQISLNNFFKILAVFMVFLSGNNSAADKIQSFNGQLKFSFLDEFGYVYKYWDKSDIDSLDNPKVCTISALADDNNFNTYVISLSLVNDGGTFGSLITITSRYIDKSSKYISNTVQNVELTVAGINIPDKNWEAYSHSNEYVLIDPSIVNGVNLYHHLTMGQPMHVTINQNGNVKEVIINALSLGAEHASAARNCMKKIHGEKL